MTEATVRIAAAEDVEHVVNIGAMFHDSIDWPFEHAVDKEHMHAYYLQLLALGGFCFFLTEDNMAGTAVAMAPDLCTGKLQAQELFWWVHPDKRGQAHGKNLYNAMEMWCKVQGVEVLAMISLEGMRPKQVGKLYERQGYHLVEHGYIKKIG